MAYPLKLNQRDLQQIYELANSYKNFLLHKEITFLFYSSYLDDWDKTFKTLFCNETIYFQEKHFAHLIGLAKNPYGLNKAIKIYAEAINKNLAIDDCWSTHGKSITLEKINNAKSLFNISKSCNEIAVLDTDVVNIKSDVITGGKVPAVFSFVNVGDKYLIPNSILKGNIKINSGKNKVSNILASVVKDEHNIYSLGMVREDLTYTQSWEVQKYLKDIGANECLKACMDKNYIKLCSVEKNPNPNRNAYTGVKKSPTSRLQNKRDDGMGKPYGGRK